MSNSFPKVSPDGRWIVYVQARNGQLMRPDSRLYIVPASGGPARLMRCNTPLMNSWHSFSPNGKWMVFSSKSRSPYTQMFLTHIDAAGNDSPAILIENSTAANRAVNIPEFVNIPAATAMKIEAPVTDYYRLIDAASDLAREHQYEAAIAPWREALERNPNDVPVRLGLGVALFETGRVAEAIAQYRAALDLSPEDPEALNNLGAALTRQGNYREAIAALEKSLAVNPADGGAHSNLGAALAQSGRVAEALPHLTRAVEYKPDDAESHTNLGLALAMAQRLDEAIPHLEKAAAISPGSFEYQFNLGRILAAAHRFDDALPCFERAVKLSGGKDPVMLDLLGGVYAELNRFAEAAETARRALDIASRRGNSGLVDTLQARLAYYQAHADRSRQ